MSATNAVQRNRKEKKKEAPYIPTTECWVWGQWSLCHHTIAECFRNTFLGRDILCVTGKGNSMSAGWAPGECRLWEEEVFHHSGWRDGSELVDSQESLAQGWDLSRLATNRWHSCLFPVEHQNVHHSSGKTICHSEVETLYLHMKSWARAVMESQGVVWRISFWRHCHSRLKGNACFTPSPAEV